MPLRYATLSARTVNRARKELECVRAEYLAWGHKMDLHVAVVHLFYRDFAQAVQDWRKTWDPEHFQLESAPLYLQELEAYYDKGVEAVEKSCEEITRGYPRVKEALEAVRSSRSIAKIRTELLEQLETGRPPAEMVTEVKAALFEIEDLRVPLVQAYEGWNAIVAHLRLQHRPTGSYIKTWPLFWSAENGSMDWYNNWLELEELIQTESERAKAANDDIWETSYPGGTRLERTIIQCDMLLDIIKPGGT